MISGEPITIRPNFPAKAGFLMRPAMYKVAYGGRGSAKSWSFARAILLLGMQRKLRVLCCREFQTSITESVYSLLCDQIVDLNLQRYYVPAGKKIRGANGTEIIFAGIRRNINSIRSFEGIDICWIEEAHTVSAHSLSILLPTIRRDPPFGPFGLGSEVWVSFNPELSTDPIYKTFILSPAEGTTSVMMNWRDNPYFPEILRKQKDAMRVADYDNYLTVWEGQTRKSLSGSIYAKELSSAFTEGRVSPHVKYDRRKPVDVCFDLGRADATSIWFVQQLGMDHNFIDFYENNGFDFTHYVRVIQERGYVIGNVYLPHDAAHKNIAAKKSVEAQAKGFFPGEGRVKVVMTNTFGISAGINAVRAMFSRFYFSQEACETGLNSLQHYQYGVDEANGTRTQSPLHNWASHAADSLRTYVVGVRDIAPKAQPQQESRPRSAASGAGSWMG